MEVPILLDPVDRAIWEQVLNNYDVSNGSYSAAPFRTSFNRLSSLIVGDRDEVSHPYKILGNV
jgi:hypothetical protein